MIVVWATRPFSDGAKSLGLIQRNVIWIFCVVELLFGQSRRLLE
jgi:hypothetical protein